MRCHHEHIRCVHGDEINAAMTLMDAVFSRPSRRAACLDCGRYLPRGLPEPCTVTGQPHPHTHRYADTNHAQGETP